MDQKAKEPANRHLYVLQPGQNVNLKNPKEKENPFLITLIKVPSRAVKDQITSRKTMTTFKTKYASKNMQYNSRKVSKTKVCNIFHVRGERKVSTKFAFLF